MSFVDRHDAGKRLADALRSTEVQSAVVVGLPRGGVVVAYEVAVALGLPLDIVVVRKLGVPQQPELGMGAVAEGGEVYLNHDVIRQLRVPRNQLADVIERESVEVRRRVDRFRHGKPSLSLLGRHAILVDDGIATGGTTRVAIRTMTARGAARITLAVPVAQPELVEEMRREVDEVVCLLLPRQLFGIGAWYQDFHQVHEEEVRRLLDLAGAREEVERPLQDESRV